MSTRVAAARVALESHLELFAVDDRTLLRAASYDAGRTFAVPFDPLSLTPPFRFARSAAVAGSALGDVVRVVASFDPPDGGYYTNATAGYWTPWQGAWDRVGATTYVSEPSVASRADGGAFYICGLTAEGHIQCGRFKVDQWQVLLDSAGSWLQGPGVATSSDGQRIVVVALEKGQSYQCALSVDSGVTFQPWRTLGEVTCDSSPAVATSGDGSAVYVAGRRPDGRYSFTVSLDGGEHWAAWSVIPDGVLNSAPTIVTSVAGDSLFVAGLGMDRRIWRTLSEDRGHSWAYGWEAVDGRHFP